jgi:hypothetical protein
MKDSVAKKESVRGLYIYTQESSSPVNIQVITCHEEGSDSQVSFFPLHSYLMRESRKET